MVDIHCHILPGLDDGARTMDEALQMAEMAVADGITHAIATPHANHEYSYDPILVREKGEELRTRVGNRLKLGNGCDFHLSYENLENLWKNPAKYTLNGKGYLLMEFADFALPPNIEETLHRLLLAEIIPIITHPERNELIRASPGRLDGWVRQGCYAQVTAGSLLGRFGRTAQQAVEEWLARGQVHFFATDAHNLTTRPMLLRPAYDLVAERYGGDMASALFRENPLAAFEGRPLPFVPESEQPIRLRKRRRFWFF